MLKKLIYFKKMEDGANLIYDISIPLNPEEVTCPSAGNLEGSVYVDEDFYIPPVVDDKVMILCGELGSGSIHIEYKDIPFDELSEEQKIQRVQSENESLRFELDLTQSALFEVVDEIERLKGGK